MRFVDIGLSFPFLLLVMAIGAALDRTTEWTILGVLGLTSWLGTARVVRAKTIQVRQLDFVLASRALGQRTPTILVRHILPNVAGILIVIGTISVAQMILAESVLSYLNLGLEPPTPTWGRMLLEGQRVYLASPWLLAAPGSPSCSPCSDSICSAKGYATPSIRKSHEARAALGALLWGGERRLQRCARAHRRAARHASGAGRHAALGDLRRREEPRAGAGLRRHRWLDGAAHLRSLLDYDSEGNIVPLLAERFETSSDGRRLTFKLREGVLFHDGSELTAADVKRSIERALHHDTPSPAASFYQSIAGFYEFHEGKRTRAGASNHAPELTGVAVDGRYLIHIDLAQPDATFLPALTLFFSRSRLPQRGLDLRAGMGQAALRHRPFFASSSGSPRGRSTWCGTKATSKRESHTSNGCAFSCSCQPSPSAQIRRGRSRSNSRLLVRRFPHLSPRPALAPFRPVGAGEDDDGHVFQHADEAVRQCRAAPRIRGRRRLATDGSPPTRGNPACIADEFRRRWPDMTPDFPGNGTMWPLLSST